MGTPVVPDGFVVPRELVTERFRLEPLGPQHNESDYAAWTSSIAHIRATPGWQGRKWPPEDGMSLEENLADLESHAREFEERVAFTYTVLDPGTGEVIGCLYIHPSRQDPAVTQSARREPVTQVSSWVTASRAELDKPLYEAVSAWLATAWPFTKVSYAQR